jgi:UDP-glucose 4-epimerase
MTRALVTGGAGFMGSHLVDYLIDRLHAEVVVLDDLSGGYQDNVHPRARFVRGSVVDQRLVDALFADGRFDVVYHLAAYAAEGLSHFIKRFNYTNNLIGSVNLINASVNTGVRCFVFTSSIAVYGRNQLPMREDLTPMPEDPYGIAKYAVEQELRVSHEMFGLDYVIFRPHNVYGERQNLGDRYRNVIGIFMNRIMQGQPLPVFGDGEQRRAFTYVGDIIPAIAGSPHVSAALNQLFNVGAERHYSVNELASKVIEAMGQPAGIEHLPARNEVRLAYSDHRRIQQVFPNGPTTALEDGLASMARWARTAGARQSRAFDGIEIARNLPPSWASAIEADPVPLAQALAGS